MLDGSDGTAGASPQGTPAADDVRAQLEILLASPELDAPARARRFLRYVVEETLAGRAERIKAYAIGTEVFERSAEFDAQGDPVVRIEAGRLRRALERYYLSEGRSDPVVITIPKGGYVPHFAWRAPATEEADPVSATVALGPPVDLPPWRRTPWLVAAPVAIALLALLGGLLLWGPWRDGESRTPQALSPFPPGGPTLVVTPFESLGEPSAKTYADGLTEEVLNQFARFKEISVLGRETSRSIPRGRMPPASAVTSASATWSRAASGPQRTACALRAGFSMHRAASSCGRRPTTRTCRSVISSRSRTTSHAGW
jgi:hypothetical protein